MDSRRQKSSIALNHIPPLPFPQGLGYPIGSRVQLVVVHPRLEARVRPFPRFLGSRSRVNLRVLRLFTLGPQVQTSRLRTPHGRPGVQGIFPTFADQVLHCWPMGPHSMATTFSIPRGCCRAPAAARSTLLCSLRLATPVPVCLIPSLAEPPQPVSHRLLITSLTLCLYPTGPPATLFADALDSHPSRDRFVPLAQVATIFSPKPAIWLPSPALSWDRPKLLAYPYPAFPCSPSFSCPVPHPMCIPKRAASNPVARGRRTVSFPLHTLLLLVHLLSHSSRFSSFFLLPPLCPGSSSICAHPISRQLPPPAHALSVCPLLCRILSFFYFLLLHLCCVGFVVSFFFSLLAACTHNTTTLDFCCCGSILVSSLVLKPPLSYPRGGPRPCKVGALPCVSSSPLPAPPLTPSRAPRRSPPYCSSPASCAPRCTSPRHGCIIYAHTRRSAGGRSASW